MDNWNRVRNGERTKSLPWSEFELRQVVDLRPLPDYHLHLTFDDGKEGIVDIKWLIGDFRGFFAPLLDPDFFAQAFVHPEFQVVTWPNEVDLDSDVLYSFATDAPIKLYPVGHKEFISVEDQLRALEATPA